MNNKLQELTDKLYNEGLYKGQEAGLLISQEAEKKAEEIIKEAEKRAKQLIQDAEQQVADMKFNAETELKLAARQIVNDVKNTIENMLTLKSITPSTTAAFNDKMFVQNLIKEICAKFNPQEGTSMALSIALPETQQNQLLDFVQKQIVKELNCDIEIKTDQKLKVGFKIGPKKNGYYISFSNDDFDNLFRDYLRPKVRQLLFELNEID